MNDGSVIEVTKEMKIVCFGLAGRPYNNTFCTAVREFSGNLVDYQKWTKDIGEQVIGRLHGIEFVICVDGRDSPVRKIYDKEKNKILGTWRYANTNEILEKTRQRFVDDRRQHASSSSSKKRKILQGGRPPKFATNDSCSLSTSEGITQTRCDREPWYPTSKNVCFEWHRHPGAMKCAEVIREVSDNTHLYPEWKDTICHRVKEKLAKEEFTNFLVFRNARGEPCESIHDGVWVFASDQEIEKNMKEQFLNNRRKFDQASRQGSTSEEPSSDSGSNSGGYHSNQGGSSSHTHGSDVGGGSQQNSEGSFSSSGCDTYSFGFVAAVGSGVSIINDSSFSDITFLGETSGSREDQQSDSWADEGVDEEENDSEGVTDEEDNESGDESENDTHDRQTAVHEKRSSESESDVSDQLATLEDNRHTFEPQRRDLDDLNNPGAVRAFPDLNNPGAVKAFPPISSATCQPTSIEAQADDVSPPACHQVASISQDLGNSLKRKETQKGELSSKSAQNIPAKDHQEMSQRLYETKLSIQQQNAPDSLDLATTYHNLGAVQYSQNRFDDALRYYELEFSIQQRKAPDTLILAITYNNIGSVHAIQSRFDDALGYYKKAFSIQLRKAPDSLDLAATYNNIASVHYKRSSLDDALRYYKLVMTIQKQKVPDSLDLAKTYHNLALICGKQNCVNNAQRYYELEVSIRQQSAQEPDELAKTYNDLGTLHSKEHRFGIAQGYYEMALAIQEQKAPDSLELAMIYHNLGLVHCKQQAYEAALDFFKMELLIQERNEPDSLHLADTYHNIGFVLERQDLHNTMSRHSQLKRRQRNL